MAGPLSERLGGLTTAIAVAGVLVLPGQWRGQPPFIQRGVITEKRPARAPRPERTGVCVTAGQVLYQLSYTDPKSMTGLEPATPPLTVVTEDLRPVLCGNGSSRLTAEAREFRGREIALIKGKRLFGIETGTTFCP